jgi:asparagine synthase (glutamine-hydrolysing)
MCGIAGIWEFQEPQNGFSLVEDMLQAMRRRGPDAGGLVSWSPDGFRDGPTHSWQLLFGHRRLRITEPSPDSDQPFRDAEAGLALSFNGEIYNFREIRSELERLGHVFRGLGEAEVILAAYAEYGEKCFSLFNGMWAIALWDARRRRLLLCRDRVGEKPLCYFKNSSRLIFASEPSALLAHPDIARRPNEAHLARYLSWIFYLDKQETFYEGILQVPPGMILEVRGDGASRIFPYWTLPDPNERHSGTLSQSAEEFAKLLTDAVRLRTGAIAPSGHMLSDGLDSNAILSLSQARNPTVWSAVSRIGGNEHARIRDLARFHKVSPNWIELDRIDWPSCLSALVKTISAPLPTPSALTEWAIVQKASAAGCRVLLSGSGGDEVLAGYERHHLNENPYTNFPAFNRAAEAWLTPEALRRLPDRPSWAQQSGTLCNRAIDLRHGLLPMLLWKDDACGMAFSLEIRAPFLDHRLIDFSFRVPQEHLGSWQNGKLLLRQALHSRLPPALLPPPVKRHFTLPRLRRESWAAVRTDGRILGYLKKSAFSDLWAQADRSEAAARRLWRFLSASVWLEDCF